MSSFLETLCHPINKNQIPVYRGFNWPCLFFGPLWFAVKGMGLWAVGSFVLSFITCGFSVIIFPFFANNMHRKHLLNAGYLSISQSQGQHYAYMTTQAPPATQQPTNINSVPHNLPNFASPPKPNLQGSFQSKRFLFVRSDEKLISAKFNFIITDIDSPAPLFKIGTQMTLTNSFDTCIQTLDGAPFIQIKGGGMSPLTTEVFDRNGKIIGKIKRKSLLNLQEFQAFDSSNNLLFDTRAKNKGITADLFLQVIASGEQPIAEVKEIDIDIVKQQIGEKFDLLDTKSWQSVTLFGGAQPYWLEIYSEIDDLSKTMLFVLMFSARWINCEGR